MKIDSNLRAAIRSAANAQPQDDWRAKEKEEKESIAAFFAKYPARHKEAIRLIETEKKARATAEKASSDLCEKFGLTHYGGETKFANCGRGSETFKKAGGKLPTQGVRWKFDAVMAELAAADEKQGAAILARIGIKWS